MGDQAEYMRQWRERNPSGYQHQRAGIRARARALTRLAANHFAEYEALCNEERAAEGLAPLYEQPVGRPRPRRAS